jgi:hypothetical protein
MYEGEIDREVQDIVHDFLQCRTMLTMPDLTVTQTPQKSLVDYCWYRGRELVYVAELKRRNCKHDHWPDYMISVTKVDAIMRYAPLGWILVLYTDGLYRIPIRRGMKVTHRFGGRTTQARDEWDAKGEICAIFAQHEMQPFDGWNQDWDWAVKNAVGQR